MPLDLVIERDPTLLARQVALHMGRSVELTVKERDWCSLALPGGSWMRAVYDELALLQLPWSQVEFFFPDARGVHQAHPASNYGMASEHLLKNPRIEDYRLHRIAAEESDQEAAAEDYERECPPSFDLVLLGVDSDGSIAALFPGSPALSEEERLYVPVEAIRKPRRRITLTPRVIEEAAEILAVAQGVERAQAVQRALEEVVDPRELPARLLRDAAWLLDPGAASALSRGASAP